jgi:hypothetical protein
MESVVCGIRRVYMNSKKTVYIHIGYPKTATTSLQNDFFPFINNIEYIGRDYSKDRLYENKFLFVKDYLHGKSQKNNPKISSKLYHLLTREKTLISEESITSYLFMPESKNKPSYTIKELISRLKILFNTELFNVKIFLSIRRQYSFIPSLFSEFYIPHYFNNDKYNTFKKFKYFFENHTQNDNFLSKLLDYDSFHNELISAYGYNNVKVLIFERAIDDQIKFLEEISSFTNETVIKNIQLSHKNKRTCSNGYKVRDLTLLNLLIAFKKKYLPFINIKIPIWFLSLSKKINFSKYYQFPEKITMSERENEKIISMYKGSNIRLSKKIGVDLHKYNYY